MLQRLSCPSDLCVLHGTCDVAEDEQFREEKGVIIKEISMLDAPPEQAAAASQVW